VTATSSLLYALLSIQRGSSATVWETCSALLRRLPQDADVIAATYAGSYLGRMLRESLGRDCLFLHEALIEPQSDAMAEAPWADEDGMLVTLDDRDLDLTPPLRFWPATAAGTARRVRTIDTLYGTTHRPGLIIIEDAAAAARILGGAAETLRRHRPGILISMHACPPGQRIAIWEDCAARLKGLDHVWLDGLMLPRVSPEQRREALEACANDVICALPSDALRAHLPQEMRSLPDEAGNAIAPLAWNDWTDHVAFDTQRKGYTVLPFDDRLPARGLHPAEHDGAGTWWRWSGPTAHAQFALPLPCAGQWRVRLEVYDWGVARDASALRVFLQGKPARCDEHGHNFGYFGPVAISKLEAGGVLTVDVVTPAPRRASDDDPRRIGVNFTTCMLERMADA
jgi:hypothetical protein